jgi:hypothetical protein
MPRFTRTPGVAALAAALLLALSINLPLQAAQAASSAGWQRMYRNSSKTANSLYGVAAVSPSDIWAVGVWGQSALVLHGTGTHWSRVTVPGQLNAELFQVAGTSPDNVWAFGNNNDGSAGTILRYNGGGWTSVTPPGGVIPTAAAVLSSTDVWIGGVESCTGSGTGGTCQTATYQWNGSSWNGPYLVPDGVNEIAGSGAGNVWLVGETGTGAPGPYRLVAYRWTGSRWKAVSMPHPRSTGPPDIAVASRRSVWLYAWQAKKSHRGYLLHWTGRAWREFVAPRNLPTEDGLVTDGSGGVWAGALAHWTGRTWVNTEPGLSFTGTDTFSLNGLSRVPGRSTLWAAGAVSRTPTSSVSDSLVARYP